MNEEEQAIWWQKTETLTGLSLVAALLLVVAPWLVRGEKIAFGVPLGYFLAAIVVPVLLVAAIFWVSGKQEKLDRSHSASGA